MKKNSRHFLVVLVLFFSILFFSQKSFANENFLFSFAKDLGIQDITRKNTNSKHEYFLLSFFITITIGAFIKFNFSK